MPTRDSNVSVWLVALGAAVWGTDTVLRNPLAQTLPSLLIVFYEHLILGAALLPVLLYRHDQWKNLTRRQWVSILGISWGGSAIATLCFTEAVKIGNPTTAVLLQKLQPLFTIALAGPVLGERLRRQHWGYPILALTGAWFVSFGDRGLLPAIRPIDLNAALLALAAAALWGSSTVLGRYLAPILSFETLTTLRIIVALPLLLIVVLAAHSPLPWPNQRQALSLVWLALVPGLVALLLYYRGLRNTPAPLAAIAELCFPASTALLNWAFLGSRLAVLQVAGFFLICGVVWRLRYDRKVLS